MSKVGRRLLGAGLLAMTMAATGCGSSSGGGATTGGSASTGKQTGPIVIGAAVAQSGNFQAYDAEPMEAFKLAIDNVNSSGGIDGRQVKIIEQNTASDKAQAKSAAESLIAKGAQILIVTCNFDYGSPAGIAAQDKGILNVSLCAASPRYGVQGIGPQAYTPAPATYLEGYAMADFAKQKGWTKPYLLTDTSLDYAQEICDGFKTHWAKIGGTLAGEGQFASGDKSIASQVDDIKQSGADSVALCTYTPGGPVALRQIRSGGVDLPIISDLAMTGTYWTKAVPNLNDFYTTANASVTGDDPDPKVNAMVKAFKERYGKALDVDYATEGYTAAEMIVEALKRTGGDTSGAALTAQFDTFHDVPTLLPTTYTPEVHIAASRPLRILQYVNGKPKYLETVTVKDLVDLKLK